MTPNYCPRCESELEEETALAVASADLVLLEATQLDVIDGNQAVSVASAAAFADIAGTPMAGSDAAAVEWVSLDELADRELRPHVARRVEKAVESLS